MAMEKPSNFVYGRDETNKGIIVTIPYEKLRKYEIIFAYN